MKQKNKETIRAKNLLEAIETIELGKTAYNKLKTFEKTLCSLD